MPESSARASARCQTGPSSQGRHFGDDRAIRRPRCVALDWSNRADILKFMLRDARMLGSTRHFHDADAARAFERDLERSPSFASATNHFLIPDDNGTRTLGTFDIKVSTLVIHGTSDPMHGEAIALAVRPLFESKAEAMNYTRRIGHRSPKRSLGIPKGVEDPQRSDGAVRRIARGTIIARGSVA